MIVDYHVISLKRSLERRKVIEESAVRCGVPLKWFEAVEPSQEERIKTIYVDQSRALARRGSLLLLTEIACAASHISLWKHLISSSADYYVIFEDDVEITNLHFMENLKKCLEEYCPLFLKLFVVSLRDYRSLGPIDNSAQAVALISGTSGLHGYVISRQAAEDLVKFCNPLWAPIDVMVSMTWKHRVEQMAWTQYPITHHDCPSEIGQRKKYEGLSKWGRTKPRIFRLYNSICKRRYRLLNPCKKPFSQWKINP